MIRNPFVYLFWLTLVIVFYVGLVLPKMISAANTAVNLTALVTIPICITLWCNAVWAVVRKVLVEFKRRRDLQNPK
jgi:hypothetical protein